MLIHTPKDLAQLVKQHRETSKLTQEVVGELVGIRQQTISAFEKNPGGTKLDTLFRILSAAHLEIRVTAKSTEDPASWDQDWES